MKLEGKAPALDDATYLEDGVAFIGDLAERVQVVEADGRPPLVQVDDHGFIIPYLASPCPGCPEEFPWPW